MNDNKYKRDFTNRMKANQTFDAYDVLNAFEVSDPMVAHAVKKLLALGKRSGGKTLKQDLDEARWSLSEAIKETETEISTNAILDEVNEIIQTSHKEKMALMPEPDKGIDISSYLIAMISTISSHKLKRYVGTFNGATFTLDDTDGIKSAGIKYHEAYELLQKSKNQNTFNKL